MSWVKGKTATREVAVVQVWVAQDNQGRVLSTHDLQAEEDLQILSGWRSGGLEQVAFALLTETVRREALLVLLMQASQNPKFISSLQSLSPAEREAEFQKLGALLTESLKQTALKLAPKAFDLALDYLCHPPQGE